MPIAKLKMTFRAGMPCTAREEARTKENDVTVPMTVLVGTLPPEFLTKATAHI